MDALRQIEAFVAVVRAGSYVKAAERQETSKAVLSRQVLELETRLGTRLLNRTTRRLSLTETGAAYFERCVQILTTCARPTPPREPPRPPRAGACASMRR